MRRLIQARLARNNEQGAIAVLVALLLIPLIGFAAYAVDVAALYEERRQLQNAADAGALVVAEDCGKEMVPCVLTGPSTEVQHYVDANSKDGTSAVEDVNIDAATNTATVAVHTRTTSGGSSLTHWFANLIGQPSTTVRARASARWNVGVATMRAFPLAFCVGEWDRLTDGGTSFPATPYPVIYSSPGTALSCPLDPNTGPNSAYPGGFGWLDGDASCQVSASVGWMPGNTGEALPSNSYGDACITLLRNHIIAMNNDPTTPPLLIPVFDNYRGTGSNGELHLAGFGAFRPVGYRFSGTHSYPDAQVCGPPATRCIKGWFTRWVTSSAIGDGVVPSFGLTTIQLVK